MANDVEIKITASDMASNVFENIKDVINSTTAEMQALTQAAQNAQSANILLAESLMICQQGYLELGSAAVSASGIMCEAAMRAVESNIELARSVYAVGDAYMHAKQQASELSQYSFSVPQGAGESDADSKLQKARNELIKQGVKSITDSNALTKIFLSPMVEIADKAVQYNEALEYKEWGQFKVKGTPDLYYKDNKFVTLKPTKVVNSALDGLEDSHEVIELSEDEARKKYPGAFKTKSTAKPDSSSATNSLQSLGNGLNAQMAQLKARMTEFYTNMADNITASLNEKMMADTGTTFERNSARLQREVVAMRRNLDQSERNGVDVTGAREELNKYETAMNAKYKKDQENSLNLLQRQNEKVNAEITGDKRAAADAQLEIAKMNIEEKMEVIRKACGSEVEAQKWAKLEIEKAEKEHQQNLQNIRLQAFDNQIERNNMSLVLEGKSHAEVNALNLKVLKDKIDEIDDELKTDIKPDRRDYLNKQKATVMQQQYAIQGYDLKTAPAEAARRLKDRQTDYAAIMVQTFDQISNSVNSHFQKMLSGAESFSHGFKGIIRDMATQIQNMMLQMVINKAIMEPMRNWFSGLLGSFGGGSSGGSSAWTLSNGTTLDRTFGFGNSPLMAGYFNKRAVGGLTSGWTLVGEEGPELVNFTQPGRVYTARQTQDMLSPRQQPTVIQMHVHGVKDTNSFRQSQSQIFASMNRALANGRRNG